MKLLYAMTISLVLAVGAGAVVAQDFQKGFAAAQRGDFVTALKEWRLLAEQGDTSAQFNLGVMYENGNGKGVLQDYAEAVKWYSLAAEQGYADAQNNLGVRYENGSGVLQDNVRAHMWYNISAANGNKKSGEWRDERAGLMTSADISKAQSMAKECMSSNYKNCDW